MIWMPSNFPLESSASLLAIHAQFFAFALLRFFGHITVQVQAVVVSLVRNVRADFRSAYGCPATRASTSRSEMARRFVAKRAIFVRFYFAFRLDEAGESVSPSVQFWKHPFVTRQIFGLIVAVRFVFSKLNVVAIAHRELPRRHTCIATPAARNCRGRFRTVPAQDRNNVCSILQELQADLSNRVRFRRRHRNRRTLPSDPRDGSNSSPAIPASARASSRVPDLCA